MNKKVLVGVGIGCGSLVLLALIAMGAGAWWLKRQVGDSVSTMMQAGQKMQELGQELAALDKQHPFTPPPEGEVLAISEPRLLDYLAVRETALPVYAELEKKAQALDDKHKGDEKADMKTAMQATGLFSEGLAQVQGAYIEGLKKHAMSPREFRTLTQTLYASLATGMLDQVDKTTTEAREKALQEVRAKLEDDSLTDEQRAALEEEERQLTASAEEPPSAPALSEASKAAAAANLALMEKYKDRIANAGSLAMDSLLVGEGLEVNTAQDTP